MQGAHKRHIVSLALAVALLFVAGNGLAQDKLEEFSMVVGEELAFSGVREFGIENQQILSANVSKDKKGVVVRALRPGVSKILLRGASASDKSRALEILVTLRDPKAVVSELEDLLRPFPNVKVRINKGRVLLEGMVKTEQDASRLRELERRFDGQVVLLATVAPPPPVVEIPRNLTVRLDLHHVSVKRRFTRRLGIRYPAGLSGTQAFTLASNALTIGPGPGLFTQTSIIGDLLPSLDFSEANGFVKLKRTDTLMTENGAKATYREGAEIYVRLNGTLGAGQLEKVFFGAELNVTPHLTVDNGAVTVEIEARISQKDFAGTQDGIPGKDLSQIHTTVHIPIGQSAMLAGVDLMAVGTAHTGLPYLSRIPILGYLFGSETTENEAAYSVVFITPTLLQDISPREREALEKALNYFDKPHSLRVEREPK